MEGRVHMVKKSLGKGLGALITQADSSDQTSSSVVEVKITEIEPNELQPRTNFRDSELEALAESIKEHGIIQPLILKKQEYGYQIVAGERRWRAARLAGLRHVPAIIKNYNGQEVLEIALVENLQRQDLNPIEEATAFQMLMDEYKLTQEAVAQKVSRSRSAIANALRLIALPKVIKDMVVQGQISAGHGRTLLSIENENIQIEVAKKIVEEQLSVRQVEELVKKLESERQKKEETKDKKKDIAIVEVEERIMHILGGKVKLTSKKQGGKIEIEYYNNEHLDKILDILEK